MAKKTTYATIKRIDPIKFFDLESTMRMLYDHGAMHTTTSGGEEPNNSQ